MTLDRTALGQNALCKGTKFMVVVVVGPNKFRAVGQGNWRAQ